ncbi:MAG: shikimate kinase, partial [Rhodothermales bacterium]
MAIPTRIYLTGFMGSGKSTVGPLLAQRLGYEFVDLDEAVEKVAGKPVQTIFVDEGEAEFRRIEALKLRAVSRRARVVISLGGGAVTAEDNLYFVVTNGMLIYLRVAPEVLAERLRNDARVRPLLLDETGHMLSGEMLLLRIRSMLEKRESFYNQADVVLDAGELSTDALVEAAVEWVLSPR